MKHDIKIGGHDVEVYVQDVKEKLHSGGIYSIVKDDFIKLPKKTKITLDKNLIIKKLDKIFNKLKSIKYSYNKEDYKTTIDKIDTLKEQLKKMRQSGLESGGEFSPENIAFKLLRRNEIMGQIGDLLNSAYDKSVSLDEWLNQ